MPFQAICEMKVRVIFLYFLFRDRWSLRTAGQKKITKLFGFFLLIVDSILTKIKKIIISRLWIKFVF
jgi:hypothetical protein